MRMGTCRFCFKTSVDAHQDLVRYSTRHNACPKCFLERFGEDGLKKLHTWQLNAFPAMVAYDLGLLPALSSIIEERRKAEEANP